jgi:sec-independent protein translocase protein TatC
MAKEKKKPNEMSFLDHLESLRWHLMRSAIAVIVLSLIAFSYKEILFDGIVFAPKRPDFWTYRALCYLSHRFNLDMCITQIPFKLVNNDLSGQFTDMGVMM